VKIAKREPKVKQPYHLWLRVLFFITFLLTFSVVDVETPLHYHPAIVDVIFALAVILIFGLRKR
jgi:hypothetical protein